MYWFSDTSGRVLYVGKAKNLKKRVVWYTKYPKLPNRLKQMVKTAVKLTFDIRESELEALLVEAELINTHQPEFNILLKDDKSALYIHITPEKFPRVLTVRKKEVISKQLKGTILGPFQSAYKVTEVLKLVRPIFTWCNQRGNDAVQKKPCFYYHLQLCSGACVGAIKNDSYIHTITLLKAFLKGHSKQVQNDLHHEMTLASQNQEYEAAARARDQLALIKDVTNPAKILKPNLQLPKLNPSDATEQITYVQKLLSEYGGVPKKYPLSRIECYDVSNTQGTNPSVAMVTFAEGISAPHLYRLFNIRSLNTPNDFAMLQEALIRRQGHPEWGIPDLIVMDGGKGQLRAAISVWGWTAPVISIAKRPDRILIPIFDTKKRGKNGEKKITSYHELLLPASHPGLRLIQQLRDEAHRFSKKQHTNRRLKSLLQ